MSRILIATGLSGNDIGGPFQYAPRLKEEFEKLGHEVRVSQYKSIEGALFKILGNVLWSDNILALDSFSVGFPSVLFAKIFRKKVTIRVGGDFIWSAYVNRTGAGITLPEFYKNMPKLNGKEKIIFQINKWVIRNAYFLAFNTEWQRRIWVDYYGLVISKTGIVRNFIPKYLEERLLYNKKFIWAGRLIPEKNLEMLKKFDVEVVTGETHQNVLNKIKNSYAVVSFAFTDVCPNFILEGVSLGKPFIMTKETGLNEIAPRGGIFVDPANEKEVGDAVDILRNEDKYKMYSDQLKTLEIGRSWSEVAKDYINLWE